MKGYKDDIEKLTKENNDFRHVLYTGKNMQLVLMSLLPKEDIGMEIHEEGDQFFRFESGVGKVTVNDSEYDVKDGDVIVVPAGARHNVLNVSDVEMLKFYTIYAPPHHQDGTIRENKEEAEKDHPEFDGKTSE